MALKLSSMLKKNFPEFIETDIVDKVNYLNTGIPTFNYVISGLPATGGFPLNGRIVTMYGVEGASKSSIAVHLIAEAQKQNFEVVYIDTECSITKPRLTQFGVQLDKDTFHYITPNDMEGVFKIISDIATYKIKENDDTPLFIVWDSIGATPTNEEMSRTFNDLEIASQAKVLTRGLRKIRPLLHKLKNTGVCFINQARENMEMFGDSIKMAGGKSLQHEANCILRIGKLKPTVDGQGVKISSIKNKLFNPFQATTLHFDYTLGFTEETKIEAFCDFLKSIGLLGQSGAWAYFTDELKTIISRNSPDTDVEKKFYMKEFAKELLDNKKLYNEIIKASEEFVQNNIVFCSNMVKSANGLDNEDEETNVSDKIITNKSLENISDEQEEDIFKLKTMKTKEVE